MLIIPLQPVPSQVVAVRLVGQVCHIRVYAKSKGLYFDLYVDDYNDTDDLVVGGVVCQQARPLVRFPYLGFVGDFTFIDTQGTDDPVYSKLGSRFFLAYIEASDQVAA